MYTYVDYTLHQDEYKTSIHEYVLEDEEMMGSLHPLSNLTVDLEKLSCVNLLYCVPFQKFCKKYMYQYKKY